MTAEQLTKSHLPSGEQLQKSEKHVFGLPLSTALAAGYVIPLDRSNTVSDSRIGVAEAKKMGELINRGTHKPNPNILSLFDGFGNTSHAIAAALPGAQVTGIDIDPLTHQIGLHNISHAGLTKRVRLYEADALTFLDTSPVRYDAIFVDPSWPSRPKSGYKSFSIEQTTPPLSDIIPKALEHSILVGTRVPLITDIAEVTRWSDALGTQLFVDNLKVDEPNGQETLALFFVKAEDQKL